MNRTAFKIVATLLFTDAAAAANGVVKSVYTRIAEAGCIRTIDERESGAHTLNCAGIAGFRLLVLYDDERSSINVVTPDKREFPLNYWGQVSPGFTRLNPKAEWGVVNNSGKKTPIGLIIRINLLDQNDLERPRKISYLAVAKVSKKAACLTSVIIANSRDSSSRARKDADAINRPCM